MRNRDTLLRRTVFAGVPVTIRSPLWGDLVPPVARAVFATNADVSSSSLTGAEIARPGVTPQIAVFEVKAGADNIVTLPRFAALAARGGAPSRASAIPKARREPCSTRQHGRQPLTARRRRATTAWGTGRCKRWRNPNSI